MWPQDTRGLSLECCDVLSNDVVAGSICSLSEKKFLCPHSRYSKPITVLFLCLSGFQFVVMVKTINDLKLHWYIRPVNWKGLLPVSFLTSVASRVSPVQLLLDYRVPIPVHGWMHFSTPGCSWVCLCLWELLGAAYFSHINGWNYWMFIFSWRAEPFSVTAWHTASSSLRLGVPADFG